METYSAKKITNVEESKLKEILDLNYLELKFHSDLPSFEYDSPLSTYEAEIEIGNEDQELSLIIEFEIENNITFDHGDYFTAPSQDGELLVTISYIIVNDYDDVEGDIDIEDEKYKEDLEERLNDFYNVHHG